MVTRYQILSFLRFTGFLRLLSDMQFVSFFLVSTFKRKLLDKYDYDLLKLVKTALNFKEVTWEIIPYG